MKKAPYQKEYEVRAAWQSWEHILRSRLESYDHLLNCIQADLSAAGMKRADSDQFLYEKVTEMLEEIKAEKKSKAV